MRQTGRTTQMLQQANEAKKRGERVLVVCPTTGIQNNVLMTARHMGFLLGSGPYGELDRKKDFAIARQIIEGRYRGFVGDIYDDHTVSEFLRPRDATDYYREVDMMTLRRSGIEPVPSATPKWKFQPF